MGGRWRRFAELLGVVVLMATVGVLLGRGLRDERPVVTSRPPPVQILPPSRAPVVTPAPGRTSGPVRTSGPAGPTTAPPPAPPPATAAPPPRTAGPAPTTARPGPPLAPAGPAGSPDSTSAAPTRHRSGPPPGSSGPAGDPPVWLSGPGLASQYPQRWGAFAPPDKPAPPEQCAVRVNTGVPTGVRVLSAAVEPAGGRRGFALFVPPDASSGCLAWRASAVEPHVQRGCVGRTLPLSTPSGVGCTVGLRAPPAPDENHSGALTWTYETTCRSAETPVCDRLRKLTAAPRPRPEAPVAVRWVERVSLVACFRTGLDGAGRCAP